MNDKIEDFEKNIFMILNDIKIEVCYFFVMLLDLNKYIMELNMLILELIESRIIDFMVNVNRFVGDINYKLFILKDY